MFSPLSAWNISKGWNGKPSIIGTEERKKYFILNLIKKNVLSKRRKTINLMMTVLKKVKLNFTKDSEKKSRAKRGQ